MADLGEPGAEPAQDLSIALEAAERWRRRAAERRRKVKAVEAGHYTEADTRTRLLKRLERLRAWQQAALGLGTVAAESLRASLAPAALQPADVTDELVERQIGRTRDLLSIEFFEQGLDAARSVGRILTHGQANGTGFLVAPGVVITNEHVLRDAAEAAASELELDFEANRFGEPRSSQVFRLEPDRLFLNDRRLDFALCAAAPVSQRGMALADYGARPLIGEEGKAAIGEPVNIVQHPGGRVKQIVIRNNRLVDLPDEEEMRPFFHYEADTERGSSGSPVFNDQWEVVALHHSSVPKTNTKGQLVDADGHVITDERDTGRIVWVANEGIRVSHLVAHIRAARLAGEAEQMRLALLDFWQSRGLPEAQERAVEARIRSRVPAAAPVRPIQNQSLVAPVMALAETAPAPFVTQAPVTAVPAALELTIPLHVSVRLGSPAAGGEFTKLAAPQADVTLERIDPDPSDPDYARRPGYDPEFLGFAASLPKVVDEDHGPVATFAAGETVLRYHHFSVVMNARRRLAYLAACNIDLAAPFQHDRQGSDRWFFDPRLAASLQAGNEYYADNPLDRGHLVRRADVAWGQSAEQAKLANDDSFHWTNCAPQHEIFNQSRLSDRHGLLLWGSLENAVAQLARRFGHRLSVLNGPVFADTDRPYRENFFVPSEYWKLILVKDDQGSPRALAFRLSQSDQIADLPRERFQPDEVAPYVPFQIAVRDLAALTGLDLDAFAAWDPLETAADRRESARGGLAGRKITSERDLVL